MMLVKQTPWLTPPRATVVRQAGNHRILPGTQIRRIAGTSNSAVEDELAHARMAWREFQSTREHWTLKFRVSGPFVPLQGRRDCEPQ